MWIFIPVLHSRILVSSSFLYPQGATVNDEDLSNYSTIVSILETTNGYIMKWNETNAFLQVIHPEYSFLHFLMCTCVFWPVKLEHVIFLTPRLTARLVPLKACGLCDNGTMVNVTIRWQLGLGHLRRLRAGLVVLHQLKNPFRCCGTVAHYLWLWVTCGYCVIFTPQG